MSMAMLSKLQALKPQTSTIEFICALVQFQGHKCTSYKHAKLKSMRFLKNAQVQVMTDDGPIQTNDIKLKFKSTYLNAIKQKLKNSQWQILRPILKNIEQIEKRSPWHVLEIMQKVTLPLNHGCQVEFQKIKNKKWQAMLKINMEILYIIWFY